MYVSDALQRTTSYLLAVRLTSTLSPTDTSLTDAHQHLPVYHTMWDDMTTREDATTQSGAVDGCLGQVQGQRGCSTWHRGANRRQSVRRGGEDGGRIATGSKGVALRATETMEHDRGGEEWIAGVGRDWESGSSSPRMSRSPPVSCVAGAVPWPTNYFKKWLLATENIGYTGSAARTNRATLLAG